MLAVAGAGVPATSAALAQIGFTEPDTYLLAAGASGVTVADMNNDGLSDVIACERIESATVFLNAGDGHLLRFGSFYQPAAALSQIQSADFDRDGNQDLIWIQTTTGNASLQIAYGRGDGRAARMSTVVLPRAAGSFTLADVTGDGWLDVVVADARGSSAMVRVFRNERGSLVAGETALLPWLDNVSLVSGDIDGDGDTDLAVLSLDDEVDYMYGWKLDHSQVRILLNDGSGAFPLGQTILLPFGGGGWDEDPFPVSLRLADMDGDRDLDLVLAAMRTANAQSPLQLLPIENVEFAREFTLREQLQIEDARIYAEVALGDLDTDGDIDVIVKAQSDVWTLENVGGFVLEQPVLVETGTYGGPALALADLNGDGQLDLVEGHRRGVSVFTNITPYEGPRLEHSPLKRGLNVTLTVTGARPAEPVHFLYTVHGAGNSVGVAQLGGVTLDLRDPLVVLGTARADSNGVAPFRFTMPPRAPLTEVVLQAVIRRGPGGADSVKTPFRTARIRE